MCVTNTFPFNCWLCISLCLNLHLVFLSIFSKENKQEKKTAKYNKVHDKFVFLDAPLHLVYPFQC